LDRSFLPVHFLTYFGGVNIVGTQYAALRDGGKFRTVEELDDVGKCSVLFCSLPVLDPRAGHTMYVLSPFIPVLCHSD